MQIFKLSAEVTVSAYTEIEAESLEDALAIAEDRQVKIGGFNTGVTADESWIIEEADGLPQNIKLAG